MRVRLPRIAAPLAALLLLGAVRAQDVGGADDAGRRLAEMNEEIVRLKTEIERMGGRERGLLAEIEKVVAERRLAEAEHEAVSLELQETEAAIAEHDSVLEELSRSLSERRRYLEFRVREIYKSGSHDWLRRFLERDEGERDLWAALSYASFLNRRDSEVLAGWRTDTDRSEREREALTLAREELAALEEERGAAAGRLAAAERRQRGALARLRDDRLGRREALGELESAAADLARLIDTMGAEEDTPLPAPSLEIRRFRGLLDWPAAGPVHQGFGTVVHPRFRTEVPHPGLDIDAPQGADIRAVFEGRVAFADWMRGYGLTVIVDHGGGVLSIYAHASVLLVSGGDRVEKGEVMGKVGDTGSLRGPYLYFELRVDGEAVDPVPWLGGR